MTGDLAAARAALSEAVAVVCHTDADGLAAGAIALRHRGEGAVAAVLLDRGQTPFSPDAPLPDGLLAILDWGVRPLARPAVIVDHHAPEGALGPLTVSTYGEQPEVPTAALMRRCFRTPRPGWRRSARSATSATPPSRCRSARARDPRPRCASSPRWSTLSGGCRTDRCAAARVTCGGCCTRRCPASAVSSPTATTARRAAAWRPTTSRRCSRAWGSSADRIDSRLIRSQSPAHARS